VALMGEREGLTARIRQMRRLATPREPPKRPTDDWQGEQIRALETRVAHLEQLLQGLQDSVHRESARHEKLIADLQAQLQPGAIGEALAKDARERGL
jgi:hypothetical protein